MSNKKTPIDIVLKEIDYRINVLNARALKHPKDAREIYAAAFELYLLESYLQRKFKSE